MTRTWLFLIMITLLTSIVVADDEDNFSGDEGNKPTEVSLESGRLSAPEFIGPEALSLSDTGELQILLPHPNVDGWDVNGTAGMATKLVFAMLNSALFKHSLSLAIKPIRF